MILHTIYLSLGSNDGDREGQLERAIDSIGACVGKITKVSNIYESIPIGFKSNKKFLNLCVEMMVEGGPHQLLLKLEAIEVSFGRLKPRVFSEYTDRPIDIDIIFFENLVLSSIELMLPHQKMQERRFVLQPLAELCPDFIHPVLKKSVQNLLDECPDESKLTLTLGR